MFGNILLKDEPPANNFIFTFSRFYVPKLFKVDRKFECITKGNKVLLEDIINNTWTPTIKSQNRQT